jgi:hypothetical protein
MDMRELSPELALIDEDLARTARAALPPAPDVLAAVARHRESEPVRRLRAALVADALPEPRRTGKPVLRLVVGGLAGLGAIAGAALVLRPDSSQQAVRVPAGHTRPTVIRAERAAPEPATPVKKAVTAHVPRRVPSVRLKAAVVRHVRSAPPAPRPARTPAPRRKAVPAKPLALTVGHAVSKPATPPLTEHLPVLTWAAAGQATHYRVGLFHDGDPPTLVCEVWTDDARLALSSVSTPPSRSLTPGEYRWVVYPVFGGNGSLGSGATADTQLAQGTFTL